MDLRGGKAVTVFRRIYDTTDETTFVLYGRINSQSIVELFLDSACTQPTLSPSEAATAITSSGVCNGASVYYGENVETLQYDRTVEANVTLYVYPSNFLEDPLPLFPTGDCVLNRNPVVFSFSGPQQVCLPLRVQFPNDDVR